MQLELTWFASPGLSIFPFHCGEHVVALKMYFSFYLHGGCLQAGCPNAHQEKGPWEVPTNEKVMPVPFHREIKAVLEASQQTFFARSEEARSGISHK